MICSSWKNWVKKLISDRGIEQVLNTKVFSRALPMQFWIWSDNTMSFIWRRITIFFHVFCCTKCIFYCFIHDQHIYMLYIFLKCPRYWYSTPVVRKAENFFVSELCFENTLLGGYDWIFFANGLQVSLTIFKYQSPC